jgi:hypothetical protein
MNFTREQLAMLHTSLHNQTDHLSSKVADLSARGFGSDRGTKDLREELFRTVVLRNSIHDYLLKDKPYVAAADIPSGDTVCQKCGEKKKNHGIDTVTGGELMCPLYLKCDKSNYDGNYHRHKTFVASPNRTTAHQASCDKLGCLHKWGDRACGRYQSVIE